MKAVRLLTTLSSRRTARTLAASTGIFRAIVGPALLARPDALARLLGMDSVTARRTAWLTRLLAGRETALGLGALHAALTGRPVRPWLATQAVSDATDATAILLAARSRHVTRTPAAALVILASAGTLAEILASRERPTRTAGNPQ
ncbi:MAG TPA: hypothetical protein VFX70_10970 [Mycobacteriales bacterium]|nr:hypothetical protein [Mycobacteriales bacterium]